MRAAVVEKRIEKINHKVNPVVVIIAKEITKNAESINTAKKIQENVQRRTSRDSKAQE